MGMSGSGRLIGLVRIRGATSTRRGGPRVLGVLSAEIGLRSAARHGTHPKADDSEIGFRVALQEKIHPEHVKAADEAPAGEVPTKGAHEAPAGEAPAERAHEAPAGEVPVEEAHEDPATRKSKKLTRQKP